MTLDSYRDRRGVVARTFAEPADAEATVRALHDADFAPSDISVLAHDPGRAEEVAYDPGVPATTGEGVGVVLGGGFEGEDAVDVGGVGLLVPNVGIVVGGPLALALAGAGEDGDVTDLSSALIATGLPDEQAESCRQRFEAGEVLVLVAAGEREADARRILEDDEARAQYRAVLRPIAADGTTASGE